MAYGGAPYTSQDLAVPLLPNISCTATATYSVCAVDLTNAGACAPMAGIAYAADIRPSLMGTDFPTMFIDYGISARHAGRRRHRSGQLVQLHPGRGLHRRGLSEQQRRAVRHHLRSTTTPTLCGGPPGTVEVGVVPDLYYGYFDHQLAQQFGAPTSAPPTTSPPRPR